MATNQNKVLEGRTQKYAFVVDMLTGAYQYTRAPTRDWWSIGGDQVDLLNQKEIFHARRAKELGLPVEVPMPEYPQYDYTAEEYFDLRHEAWVKGFWVRGDNPLEYKTLWSVPTRKETRQSYSEEGTFLGDWEYEFVLVFCDFPGQKKGVVKASVSGYQSSGSGPWGNGPDKEIRDEVRNLDPDLYNSLEEIGAAMKRRQEEQNLQDKKKEIEGLKKHFGL